MLSFTIVFFITTLIFLVAFTYFIVVCIRTKMKREKIGGKIVSGLVSTVSFLSIALASVPMPTIYPLEDSVRVYEGIVEIKIDPNDSSPFIHTYYSLDGSDLKDGYVYERPFTITSSTTVFARNKFLWRWSEPSRSTYAFNEPDVKMEERYYKGTTTKTGWESKFIGLRYTNPEGMSMSTEDELDEMNEFEGGTPSIVFNQDELGYMRLTTVIEMYSVSDDQSVIVGICVERLIDDVDLSQFIEEFESQMDWHPFYN